MSFFESLTAQAVAALAGGGRARDAAREERRAPMSTNKTKWVARCVAGLRELGPYAAIELLVPGGSILAAMLFLYRRSHAAQGTAATRGITANVGASRV